MRVKKRRLCILIPVSVYDRLQSDSDVYGVPKSNIINNALLEYYARRPSVPAGVKGTE